VSARSYLAGQDDHGDAVHQGVGHAGDGVGCAGAGGDQNDAGFAGGTGVPLGRMGRALFVADQNVTDVVLLEDRVIDGKYGAAGIAENHIDALILQGFDDDFCTSDLGASRFARHFLLTPSSRFGIFVAVGGRIKKGPVRGPCARCPGGALAHPVPARCRYKNLPHYPHPVRLRAQNYHRTPRRQPAFKDNSVAVARISAGL
jgi:hypothetical protein